MNTDGLDFWGGISASSFELTISSSRFLRSTFFLKLVAQIPGIRKRPKPIVISRKCAKNDFRPITKIIWHTRSFHNMYSTQTAFNLFFIIRRVCVRNVLFSSNLGFFWQLVVKILSFKKSFHFFLSRKSLGCGNSSFN